jgi:hypothetical protein
MVLQLAKNVRLANGRPLPTFIPMPTVSTVRPAHIPKKQEWLPIFVKIARVVSTIQKKVQVLARPTRMARTITKWVPPLLLPPSNAPLVRTGTALDRHPAPTALRVDTVH